MTPERMFDLVARLGDAKSRQNVDEALTLQHEDMVLRSPAFGSEARGKPANAAALTGFFKWFPDYAVTLEGHASDGEALVAWGRVKMTWTGDRLGVVPNGQQADIPVFMRFTFKDDLIDSELFFIDLAELCAQSGVSTDRVRATLFG